MGKLTIFASVALLFLNAAVAHATIAWEPVMTNYDAQQVIFTTNGDMYCANSTYNVCRSQDGGTTWTAINQGLSTNGWVWRLCLNASGEVIASMIMYSASQNLPCVFLLAGNGTSWTQAAGPLSNYESTSILDSQGNLLAAIAWGGTVWRSTNNGTSFTLLSTINAGIYGIDRCVDTNGVSVLFAGTETLGLLESLNDGQTWTNLCPTYNASTMGNCNGGIMNAKGEILLFGRTIMRYTGNGNWSAASGIPGASATIDMKLAPDNVMYASGVQPTTGYGVYYSTNNGLNWAACNTGLPSLIKCRRITFSSDGRIYVASDHGIYRTTAPVYDIPTVSWTITVQTVTNGTISPSGSITVANGASTNFSISANAYYQIQNVLVDGLPVGATNQYMFSNVTTNHTISASFVALLAAHGTPLWWLAQYGYTNNFDAAELADPDYDGLPTWQEYLAGTNPTNSASVLKCTSAQTTTAAGGTNKMVLVWSSQAGKVYTIDYSTNLLFSFVPVISNILATYPLNTTTVDEGLPNRWTAKRLC